jgi:hypothetical protein
LSKEQETRELFVNTQKVLGRVGLFAVLLAIFSGAPWEFIGKPLIEFVFSYSLVLLNLAHHSLRDQTYQVIAMGHHEKISMLLLFLFVGCLTGFTFAAMNRDRKSARISQTALDQVSRQKFLKLLIIVCLSFMYYPLIRAYYVNSAITYFDQAYKIALPALSQEERDRINSNFAGIQSREDYVQILKYLEGKAQSLSKSIPEAWIW